MASVCNVRCAVRALLRHARRVPSTPSTRVLSSAPRATAAAAAGFNGFTRASNPTVGTHRGRPPRTQTALASTLNPEGTIDANLGGGSVDQVRITRVDGSNVGELSDVLLSLGATCCSVEDADLGTERETELYAGDDKVWHMCDVTAMFPSGCDIDAVMADAVDILGVKSIEYVVETIPDNDWVNVVMDSFVPIKVGDGLWIVPEWAKTLPEGEEGALSVVLEPGLAFGTGEHPTTRLCLGWLRDNAAQCVRGKHVVDFGTGSGVLAIGALLMGAAKATGVDVDPLSVKSARRNAQLNGIDETRLALFCADGSDGSDLPPDCDDAVACTIDGCDETADTCRNIPEDGMCGASEMCSATMGCVPECTGDADCDDGLFCNGAET